jgi:hypothetical protein
MAEYEHIINSNRKNMGQKDGSILEPPGRKLDRRTYGENINSKRNIRQDRKVVAY